MQSIFTPCSTGYVRRTLNRNRRCWTLPTRPTTPLPAGNSRYRPWRQNRSHLDACIIARSLRDPSMWCRRGGDYRISSRRLWLSPATLMELCRNCMCVWYISNIDWTRGDIVLPRDYERWVAVGRVWLRWGTCWSAKGRQQFALMAKYIRMFTHCLSGMNNTSTVISIDKIRREVIIKTMTLKKFNFFVYISKYDLLIFLNTNLRRLY